jgi:CDP-diglyceride synthetase
MSFTQDQPRQSRNQLLARVLSGAVLIPLVFLSIWAGSPWFPLVVIAVTIVGLLEFYALARSSSARPALIFGLIWATTLLAVTAFYSSSDVLGLSIILAVITIGAVGTVLSILTRYINWIPNMLGLHIRRKNLGPYAAKRVFPAPPPRKIHQALSDWAFTVIGPIYLGIPLMHLLLLRQIPNGSDWVMLALAGTFATDTGAFAVGKIFGRRRLAPRISPAKTWEGAIGGFVLATIITPLVTLALSISIPIVQAALLGALIGLVAQLGDLAMSMFKRAAAVKESGNIIPGHGGVLDRLDSLVFSVVLVYYFVRGIVL